MEALILSCGTGGGHNSAAHAMEETLQSKGFHTTFLNPYDLVGEKVTERVNNAYIKIAQRTPRLFGLAYFLGNLYRLLPWRSPIYFANRRVGDVLAKYLSEHKIDVVVTTHLFPAQMLTYLKEKGVPIPRHLFIATDYACIPFEEECFYDACVIPSKDLTEEFVRRGIPREKIFPLGIPVSGSFQKRRDKQEAKAELGLDPELQYLLVAGGSIGAGKIAVAVELLYAAVRNTNRKLIVITGNNTRMYHYLKKVHGDRIILLTHTDQMGLYMKACDIYFTKPGGLSITEAAVSNIPIVLLPPIPGCENLNRDFFCQNGMAVRLTMKMPRLKEILSLLEKPEVIHQMQSAQTECINANAAGDIAELAM